MNSLIVYSKDGKTKPRCLSCLDLGFDNHGYYACMHDKCQKHKRGRPKNSIGAERKKEII